MNRVAAVMIFVAVGAATGMYLVFRPAPLLNATAQPVSRTFSLVVGQKKLLSGPATLTVNQGDRVEIRVQSDVMEELHLHGYNLMMDLKPEAAAHLDFTADRSGRFEYELEQSGIELGVLEVAPQ